MIDTAEVRRGFAEARGFLLSHHLPGERYRCYSPALFGREVHLCARCSGVYPGIAAGLLASAVAPVGLTALVLVALLPIPALVDWTATSFTERQGSNPVRTLTGALLGYGYGLGLAKLFLDGNVIVLEFGLVYAVVAAALLYSSGGS